MKNTLAPHGVLVAITLFLSVCCACTKNGIKKKPISYTMSATIDTTTVFTADSCVYYFPNFPDSTVLVLGGWTSNSLSSPLLYPQIQLSINSGYHGVGTYYISYSGTSASAELELSAASGGYGASGSIIITGTAPLEGTFIFTTTDGHLVTNGSFTALRF